MNKQEYKDGEPCSHPGCMSHVSHSCEGCGRIWGKTCEWKWREQLGERSMMNKHNESVKIWL